MESLALPSPMPPSIRSTQRAPQSCTACYARKVKCSREIPCRACISRGAASSCRREVVRVRGQLRTAGSSNANPTYEALLQENARLSALVASRDASATSTDSNMLHGPTYDMTEQHEKRLFRLIGETIRKRGVFNDTDVCMPSMECSEALVHHARIWTSWIHFAFFFPDFQQLHSQFWQHFSPACSSSLSEHDPLWLAIYFSVLSSTLLFVDEEEFLRMNPPRREQEALLRNWYDSALYFLDRGDFMQKQDITVVRTIVVLGIVATNIGDTCRHSNLWACALRIAEQLKLGSDECNTLETVLEREVRRRLWWTLVLCEWLPCPTRTPCINDTDFDCDLPADVDDEQLQATTIGNVRFRRSGPRPVQYHIAMSRVAIIFYQLRSKIRLRRWSAPEIAQFVFSADDQLASLIGELPTHLQNDEPETPATLERDAANPWIPWQKKSLTMVLLYHRIAINRILQTHWLEGSTNYARARSICLSSAVAILNSATTDAAPTDISRMRPW